MEAIKEIGIVKVARYVFFSLWQYVFAVMFVSPLRVWLLRIFGATIGKDTIIDRIRLLNLYRIGLRGFTIGDRCFLGDGVVLDLADRIMLEDDVTLSFDVMVLTHTNVGYKGHPLQRHIPSSVRPVRFEKGSFAGARAVILPGVTVGESAAVAAGALVTKNVAARILVGGIPAKTLRKLKP